MSKTVLMILLALPMLLPQGFCLCRLGASRATTRESRADTARPCCNKGCCATPPRPAQRPQPPADDHAPGCPASPAYAVRAATFVVPMLSDVDLALVPSLIDTLPTPPSHADRLRSSEKRTCAPTVPLFLLVCAFRC